MPAVAVEDQTPEEDEMGRLKYRQWPAASGPASHIGSNPARQAVGDPGHCEDCVSVGHVTAHPELGCGDVGCTHTHEDNT